MVQAKAAGILKPEAQQRYVEDFKIARTPAWAKRCHLPMGVLEPDAKCRIRIKGKAQADEKAQHTSRM